MPAGRLRARIHETPWRKDSPLVSKDPREAAEAEKLSQKAAALCAVAAAAALRSETALWQALEEALVAGVPWEEMEQAIKTAARVAESVVEEDGLRTLREIRARAGAQERWGIPKD